MLNETPSIPLFTFNMKNNFNVFILNEIRVVVNKEEASHPAPRQSIFISKCVLSFLKYETRKRKHNEKKD